MTGPEHYQAAEKLLDAADAALTAPGQGREYADTLIAEAQAHATLALACDVPLAIAVLAEQLHAAGAV